MISRLMAYGLGAALLAVLSFAGVQTYRLHNAQAAVLASNASLVMFQRDSAQVLADAQAKAQKATQEASEALADAATQYEKGKNDAQVTADRTIADLRSGAIVLRQRWKACSASAGHPATAATTGQPDAAADIQFTGPSDLVRVAETCDAQVTGLQQVIRGYLGK